MSFNHSTYIIDEDDGSIQPVLVLSNPSSTDITIQVVNEDSTATGEYPILKSYYYYSFFNNTGGGVDYNSGPYTVILPAGLTSALFDIAVYNDTILEDDENFTLTINSSSAPDGISGGQATVIIMDDDRK